MSKYYYKNPFGIEFEIIKMNNEWHVWQDGVPSSKTYKRLKDAKKAIDNQEIYFD